MDNLPPAANAYESSELGELFTALAKAQMEIETAKPETSNPYFKSKYADLASVVKASRKYLAKNGLCVVQRIVPNGNGIQYLCSRLCHSSGQWMESRMAIMPPKNDIQTIGSYITYLRRYTYAAIVGVVASEEDDDGNSAQGEAPLPPKTQPKINRTELKMLAEELGDDIEMLERLLTAYEIVKLGDLPSVKFSECMKRVRKVKQTQEGSAQ